MFLSAESNTARHGASQHLVSRYGNGINRLFKANDGGPVHERHHHCKERTVTMDVITLARDIQHFQYPQDAIQIVDGSLDSGTNVDINNDGAVKVLGNFRSQSVIINLSHGQCGDALGIHAVVAGSLEDTVVSLLGTVQDAIGVALTCEKNAVKITFRSTRGHVTPVRVGFHIPELGEKVNDTALELTGVNTIVGGDIGVAEVVDGVLHEFVELLVVVHEIVGVSKVNGRLALEELIVGLQNVRFVRKQRTLLFGGGDHDGFFGEKGLLVVRQGFGNTLSRTPCIKDSPRRRGARLFFVGRKVLHLRSRIVVHMRLVQVRLVQLVRQLCQVLRRLDSIFLLDRHSGLSPLLRNNWRYSL
mmetsp:Transcript_27276/g.49547  ORF Transcript_27276/g.49547 Transcript_27276/m.49547 type:complete len:359 (+) Transcript_27276:2373-3449(+)